MDIQSVLVEKCDKASNNVYTASGLMLEEKYVIITSSVLTNIFNKKDLAYFRKLNSSTMYLCPAGTKFDEALHVVWKAKNDDLFTVKKSRILALFLCDNIRNTGRQFFRDWSIDHVDNCADLPEVLSLFFILKINDSKGSFKDFKNVLKQWWNSVCGLPIEKGDDVFCKSSAFGNRQFLNSSSKGIVSNVFGKNSCFLLSDCPTTPGSEGSPVWVVKNKNKHIPLGLVLSSSIWWQKGWVGLTLMADIRPILAQLIDIRVKIETLEIERPNFKLLATTELSLAQVYSGNLQGTAVLISKEKGIFISNSHVIGPDEGDILLKWRDKSLSGKIIHKSSQADAFDLAVIKCHFSEIENLELLSCNVQTSAALKTGDPAYTAGFSLLSKDCEPTPLICKGYISSCNKYMIKTTGSVHPGSSGGALLDPEGRLLGILVCNVKLDEERVYPRFSVAIPISAIWEGLSRFLNSGDVNALRQLTVGDRSAQVTWYGLEGKL